MAFYIENEVDGIRWTDSGGRNKVDGTRWTWLSVKNEVDVAVSKERVGRSCL